MKRLARNLVFIWVLITLPGLSFAGNCIDVISRKLSNGDASGVAAHFDHNLSLSLPGCQSNYSHAQAAMILNDFFEKHNAQKATIERTGDNASSTFAIGKLVTSKGTYRLYLVVKENKNDCIIKEMRLER